MTDSVHVLSPDTIAAMERLRTCPATSLQAPALWRQMHTSALAAPPSPDGPAHRFASMLDVVAGYLNKHGHQDAAFLLLAEADQARQGVQA
jgi:hypothetical protein